MKNKAAPKQSKKLESPALAAAELAAAEPAAADLVKRSSFDEADQLAAENEEMRSAQSELEDSRNRYAQLYDLAPVGYITLSRNGRIENINLTGARMLGCEREQLIGAMLNTFANAPGDLGHLLTHLRQCRKGAQKVLTRLELKTRSAQVLAVQLISNPAGETLHASYLTILTDLSEQAHFERVLNENQAAVQRLNESLELRVLARTAALRKSELLKQSIFESIAAEVVVLNTRGDIIEYNQPHWGLATSALFQIENGSSNYLDVCQQAAEEAQDGAAQAAAGIAAVLGGSLERFNIEYRKPGSAEADRWFSLTATPLADGAGVLLLHEDISEQKNLQREILEVSEKERRRIGQDLHDGLCQHLTGTALLATALARSLADGPAGARALEIANYIRTAVDQTRHVARGLHPVEIDACGLSSALQELADDINKRLPCVFHYFGDIDVGDSEVAVNLFRITQEAVDNVIKHAQAHRIDIHLKKTGAYLLLTIEDNGIGLQHSQKPRKGMGINIMKYRASTLGAKLDVVNLPEHGVRVRCSLPFSPK